MTASGGAGGLGGAQTVNVAQAQAAAASQDAQEIIASQESSEMSIIRGNEDLANPAAATRVKKKEDKFQALEARRKTADKSEKKSEQTGEKGESSLEDRFTEDTVELSGEGLRGLKNAFSDDSSPEDILAKLSDTIKDPALQDIALDYLIQTAPSDGKLHATLIQVKQQLLSQNPQKVKGGRNVLFASQEYAAKANTSPSTLRALYVQVTSGPTSCAHLRQMFSPYAPSEKTIIMDFLASGMVADLKAEGPSIPPSKLQTYMTELSNLQAINSVETFFEQNMASLEAGLKNEGYTSTGTLTHSELSKSFFQLIEDKFPSSSKTQKAVVDLVGPETGPQSLVLNLFFRALSSCSPRIYSGAEKKQQLATVITNTLDAVNMDNEDYPKPGDFPRTSYSSTPPHAPVPQSDIPTTRSTT